MVRHWADVVVPVEDYAHVPRPGRGPMKVDAGADWHTHSTTSDGVDSLADMAAAGAAAGLHTLGLSDHVRESTAWLPEYVTAVRALRVDGLEIRCGVEVKMLDAHGRLDLPSSLPELDYLLVADHQFPGADGPVHPARVLEAISSGRLSRADAVEQVVTATCGALRSSPVPGHRGAPVQPAAQVRARRGVTSPTSSSTRSRPPRARRTPPSRPTRSGAARRRACSAVSPTAGCGSRPAATRTGPPTSDGGPTSRKPSPLT